jgi:hypothetical protein
LFWLVDTRKLGLTVKATKPTVSARKGITCHATRAVRPDPSLNRHKPAWFLGKTVLLAFHTKTKQEELMWVEIQGVKPANQRQCLHGILRNRPLLPLRKHSLKLGSHVTFATKQICKVY